MLKFILLFGIAQQVGGNSTLTRNMSTQIVTQELLNVITGTKFAANFLRYSAALTKRFSCFSDCERKARLPKPLTTDQRVIVIAGTYLLLLVTYLLLLVLICVIFQCGVSHFLGRRRKFC